MPRAHCSPVSVLWRFIGAGRGARTGRIARQAEGRDSYSRASGYSAASSHLPGLRTRAAGGTGAEAAPAGEQARLPRTRRTTVTGFIDESDLNTGPVLPLVFGLQLQILCTKNVLTLGGQCSHLEA